ncbi:tRNA uridine-5-carboxymethylaminomethyl(34) synthesis GTPase MnmE [Alloacidobacterium sp.]|uniref:tRNA uridine-5-carboxymethylaminomethyl(34) synthesis GTPase MnmE n=1 Tax=Alloacidobacterium sp. TaxID=2951999 RepID=UPI002D4D6F67|nr:tRNA uridine-5-carboxymethylaminomethyl(34) synthesis GTPase MnmE [Alloacidobacterium sp.]HYK37946.1 tRNA uridine-5-carboxymethylaminomethyl(34) synthesis GTPase MnmE [Alloacidobacterium sp.]
MQSDSHPAIERAVSENDTIVAISTPPGRGGIGIVRLSGADALAITQPLLKLRGDLEHARARFAEIIDPETQSKLDEAIVTYFAGPHSYTGEDIVEIAAHGSPVILDLLVRQLLAGGARLAEPGEFTERAFLSGRIDLTQAEAVRDLIESQTLYQARVAAQQLGGSLSRRIKPIKQGLVELIALLEAGIDFAEDDVDITPDAQVIVRIGAIAAPLTELARTFEQGRIVHSGLALAIIGSPNVGKSSLFNRLVERERAIVTAMPGTTRDLVTEKVAIGGIPIELVDTAGLREAADEAESIGIQKSREALADADLVLIVLDASAPVHPEEEDLIKAAIGRRVLIADNKADLADSRSRDYDSIRAIRTSALTGEGISELRSAILDLVRVSGSGSEDSMLTNVRHHQAVESALESLGKARNAVSGNIPHEMLLLDLYTALRQLDALTGETTSDDVLNLIFSTFCIGK